MEEKTATYAIIGASIVGIIIVAFLVITGIPSGSYFSELYFENHTELPSGVNVGSDQTFSFTVVSHEKNATHYSYNATYGNQTIGKGNFNLQPGDSETTEVSFTPQQSTLKYVTSDNSTETSQFTISKESKGKILVIGENGSVKEIKANKSEIGLILGLNNVIWTGEKIQIPVRVPVGEQDVHNLELDLNSKEEYMFTYSTSEETDSSVQPNPFLSESELGNLSSYGYNEVNKTVRIENDEGNVKVTEHSQTSKFRYEKKKVQVNVVNDLGKQYEIHFWTMVRG